MILGVLPEGKMDQIRRGIEGFAGGVKHLLEIVEEAHAIGIAVNAAVWEGEREGGREGARLRGDGLVEPMQVQRCGF